MKKTTKNYFYLGSSEKNILGSQIAENRYDNEEYIFDINSKNDGHTAIARRVKENSTVLDIGCASGLTGKLLKDFKNCIVDGIEYDETAIKVAKKRACYRDLFTFSITDVKSKKYQQFFSEKRKYDYIIFCDVLEHLDKPWEVLVQIRSLLKENGCILISLPNIAHIDMIKSLLSHEFNYASLGLLDSTHIRFFTASSFVDMIENIGDNNGIYYNIELYEKIKISPSYINDSKLFSLLSEKLKKKNDMEEYMVLQNIFELSLAPNKNQMKIKLSKSNHNFFEGLDKILVDYISELEKENSELSKRNKELLDTLNQILNSKRWKFVTKIDYIKNIIFRKKD